MSDDPATLASAYIDGELTADERALVEADPILFAEVARLRTVRALLASAEPGSISVRERHLASALDAWDRLGDATPPGAVTTELSSRAPARTRRGRVGSTAWLGAAAAGLVVVMGAGLVVRNATNDSTDDSAAQVAEVPESDEQTDGARDVSAEPESARPEAAAAVPAEGSLLDTGAGSESPPAEVGDLEQLSGPDDLAVFATNALVAPTAADLPAGATVITEAFNDAEVAESAELPMCGRVDRVVGLAEYNGVEVVVGIDTDGELAIASIPADCSEVARASLR